MGLIVNVYRNANDDSDCTNDGLSSRFTSLTVVNVAGPFEPTGEAPAVMLVSGPYDTARLFPADLVESDTWVTFGGNIGVTSDSRFGHAISKITGKEFENGIVKIFDRVEYA